MANASLTQTAVAAPRRSVSWWKAPQRVWLRRALFQIHLWLGLIVTLYAVVIGVSGSVLVFREEMEAALYGQLVHVREQPGPTHLETSIRSIEAARPDYIGIGLEDFGRRDQPALLLMQPKHGAQTGNYRLVHFNPYTGDVLLDRQRYDGFLGWMTNLHFYLLAGKTGILVSGYMAMGLLVLCITGLVLWWPGVRRWRRSLVLRWRVGWQRLNWDLHSVIGFWCCASLALFSFTGVYFAFPEPTAKFVVWATGGTTTATSTRALPPTSKSGETTSHRLTIDQALAVISTLLPADAPAGYLQLPAKADAPYNATGYYKDSAPFSQLVQVSIDPHSGAQLSYNDTRNASRGMRIIQYFFAVHFGSFGGSIVKSMWVLLGLAAPLLGVTGLLMYWNRKLRPLLKRID